MVKPILPYVEVVVPKRICSLDTAYKAVVEGAPYPTTIRLGFKILRAEAWLAPGGAVVELLLSFADRDTGEPREGNFNVKTDVMDIRTPSEWGQAVRHALQTVLMHEVDEAILVEGKRLFDPHPPGDGGSYEDMHRGRR